MDPLEDKTLIADLVRAGVTDPDLLQRVANVMHHAIITLQSRDASRDDYRAQSAERSRKYRQRHKTSRDAPRGRVDDSSSSRDISGEKENRATPRDELKIVLDDRHADALIEHRQRIRKPLTAHAARLLAEKLGQTPNPNQAADIMIANGWQGFEPKWIEGRGVTVDLSGTTMVKKSEARWVFLVARYEREKGEKFPHRAEQWPFPDAWLKDANQLEDTRWMEDDLPKNLDRRKEQAA